MRAMTRVQENVSPRDCSSRTVATGRRERAAPPAGRNGHFDAAPAATEQAVVVARARARSSLGGPDSPRRNVRELWMVAPAKNNAYLQRD
ncbi:hypothetical protein GN956_G3973 [Arapaima gigas]